MTLNLASAALSPDVTAAECRLAILGDSLTAGYGVALADGFPAKLGRELNAQGITCAIADAGVSGDTSAGGLARLNWVLGDQPTHLLVELGGNDGLRGLPVAQLEQNLDQIIIQGMAAGVQLFLAGIVAPPNLGQAYTDAFKAVYVDLAARHQVPLYPFMLEGVITERALMQSDGIHPNDKGVDEMVRRIAPSLIAWLRATGVASSSH